MKKKTSVLLSIVFITGLYILISCQLISRRDIGIIYSNVNTWSENDDFWGRILYNQIEITNKKTKGKNIIELPIVTDQFVLGSNYVYILERGDNISSTKAKIYRYTFVGEYVDVWEMDQISHIYFEDGKMFFQYWIDEDQSYPYIIQNGMIANSYVEEKDFGKKIKKLKADKEKKCKVGEVVFYQNPKGYFSTEQEYNGYSGVCSSTWGGSEPDSSFSDQETEHIKVLKEKIAYDQDYLYEMLEYQKKKDTYGILIKYKREKRFKQNYAIPLGKVYESYAYKINMEKKEASILKKIDDKCMVVSSESCCVYVEDDYLKRWNYKTGTEEILFEMDSDNEELTNIYLEDKYLRVVAGDQFYYISWIK